MDNSNFAEFDISLESLKRQMKNSLKQASKDLLYSKTFMTFVEHFLIDESMLKIEDKVQFEVSFSWSLSAARASRNTRVKSPKRVAIERQTR